MLRRECILQKLIDVKGESPLRKYVLVVLSLFLVFSPFSSLGELAYAEDEESDVGSQGEFVDDEEATGSDVNEGDASVTSEAEEEDEDKTGKSESSEGATLKDNEKKSSSQEQAIQSSPSIQANALGGGMQLLANVADDYEYTAIPGQGTTINKYIGNDTHVTIPASLGYSIRVIAENAFEGKGIEAVTMPRTVTEIRDSAFANNNLSEIIITNENVQFGTDVFAGNHTSPNVFTFFGLRCTTAAKYEYINSTTLDINYHTA